MFVGECILSNLLHLFTGWAPRIVVSSLANLGLHFTVVHHHVGAANHKQTILTNKSQTNKQTSTIMSTSEHQHSCLHPQFCDRNRCKNVIYKKWLYWGDSPAITGKPHPVKSVFFRFWLSDCTFSNIFEMKKIWRNQKTPSRNRKIFNTLFDATTVTMKVVCIALTTSMTVQNVRNIKPISSLFTRHRHLSTYHCELAICWLTGDSTTQHWITSTIILRMNV